jgi:prepilin-type N-terminal cleavage/methylation domain-containing protein
MIDHAKGAAERLLRSRVRLSVPGACRWARRTSRRRLEAGFTLVEVITAIAILSLALGSLMSMIGNALRQTGQADRMAEAGSLAQALLARLGPELQLGDRQDVGQLENGFHWRLSSQRFGDAGDQQQWPIGAYKVSVEVGWHDGFRVRSFTLTTLRLGPKEAAR